MICLCDSKEILHALSNYLLHNLYETWRLARPGAFFLFTSVFYFTSVFLFCLRGFFFVCMVSFLFAWFHFYLRGFFFICVVSFLFAWFLFYLLVFSFVCVFFFCLRGFLFCLLGFFCLQRVPCRPSYMRPFKSLRIANYRSEI